MPTREQLTLAREGDPLAVEAVRDFYLPFIHGVVLAYVPHHLAQGVAEEVWQALRTTLPLEADQAGPSVLSATRRAARAMEPKAEHPAPLRSLEAPRRWLDAMRTTPAPQREWATLRLVEGISGDELALVSGTAPGSLKAELSRAVKAIAIAMGRSEPVDAHTDAYLFDFTGQPSPLIAEWELWLPNLRGEAPELATQVMVPVVTTVESTAVEATPVDSTHLLSADDLSPEAILPPLQTAKTLATPAVAPPRAAWPWVLLGLALGISLTWLFVRGLPR